MHRISNMLSTGFSAALVLSTLVIPVNEANAFPWSGLEWNLKDSGDAAVGPGPNVFSGDNVFVDDQNRLHMLIEDEDGDGVWRSSEIISTRAVGYGTYTMTLETPIRTFHNQAVLGFFTWSTRGRSNEMDVEIARFRGTAAGDPRLVHSLQPQSSHYAVPDLWNATFHQFVWDRSRTTFLTRPLAGAGTPIQSSFGSPPRPTNTTNLRINFWLRAGVAPAGATSPLEVIIRSVSYTPA
ncbi:glycoside hydrolase family 16 protein [Polyangium mundeleinium]|uniref:Glycoside hydrolase family 16 protein n=1 Tax=Polyangium mundeleinium TaxID=2995306 RepID=A0ABT5EJU7_9BACT|nr:glycoside hydrolase family 16 protein [Polyangium mundeleinium]MDC0742112.1 glycoside hydrolase family 16 protein [Polyangium mundeleinium]